MPGDRQLDLHSCDGSAPHGGGDLVRHCLTLERIQTAPRGALQFMIFDFEPDPALPLLAWCARARPGHPVRVRHGAHVETRVDGFVEGAWDGDFEAFDFDLAETLAGSGGRLRNGGVVF